MQQHAAEFAQFAHAQIGPQSAARARWAFSARVAELVEQYCQDEVVTTAAWLHDVVTSTPVSLADISRTFGIAVSGLVHALSLAADADDPVLRRHRLSRAPAGAQSIALAALIVVRRFGRQSVDPRDELLVDALTEAHPGLVNLARLALRQDEDHAA